MDNPMDTYERLKVAAEAGETFTIIYHGGSQPGRKRQITPTKVTQRELRARDEASGTMKNYLTERIEVVSNDSPAKEYVVGEKDIPEYSSLTEAFEGRIAELKSLGWHVDLSEKGISLSRYFKNGKPRKSPDVAIHKRSSPDFEDLNEFDKGENHVDLTGPTKAVFSISFDVHTMRVETESKFVREEVKPTKPRPWYVFGPELTGRSYSHLDRAVALFWSQAKKFAPKSG